MACHAPSHTSRQYDRELVSQKLGLSDRRQGWWTKTYQTHDSQAKSGSSGILTNDRLMQAEGIKTCIVPVGYPEFSQTILEFEMMKVTSDKGCENLIDIAPTKLA
ncbi:MAG: hypothetical protein K2X77_13375 [Candidatus Obscuribacterales bacterium]|jgi:hypothetical protein|nr:hypothetical protein [Candidatus Obscuribacterales bacterium]